MTKYVTDERVCPQYFDVNFDLRADLAIRLVERFGSVAAIPDGEDKAGRQQLRLQTPDELVERCFAIAERFVEAAERRGLITPRQLSMEERERQCTALALISEDIRDEHNERRYEKRLAAKNAD